MKKLKRILMRAAAFALSASMLIGGQQVFASGAKLSVDSVDAKPGETVTVAVRIEGNTGLSNFDLQIDYGDGLTLTQVTKTDCACAGGMFIANTAEGIVIWASADEVTDSSATLFTLTFTVNSDAGAGKHDVSVSLTDGGAFRGSSGELNVSFEAGTVNVAGSSQGSGGQGSGSQGTSNKNGSGNAEQPDIQPVFTDVSVGAWYFTCVGELAAAGVVSGYPDGSFKPDGTVTWAEALKLILLSAGYPLSNAGNGKHWAANYYSFATENGLAAEGIDIDAPISRIDIAHVLCGAVGLEAKAAESPFNDCDDASAVALYNAGLIKGYENGGFGPQRTISRAEIAMIIWRLYSYVSTGSVQG